MMQKRDLQNGRAVLLVCDKWDGSDITNALNISFMGKAPSLGTLQLIAATFAACDELLEQLPTLQQDFYSHNMTSFELTTSIPSIRSPVSVKWPAPGITGEYT
jgi:hypothetical protein